MSDQPTSHVKIYDRPEKKAPSPLMLVIGLLFVLLVGLLVYKALHHSAAPVNTPPGIIRVSPAFWQDKGQP